MSRRIKSILLCDDATPNDMKAAAIHNFLTGVLELDIGRLQSHQEQFYRRHEDSLLSWVKQFNFFLLMCCA